MKETFLLRMPNSLKDWLSNDAENRGLTLTALIVYVLSEYKRQEDERNWRVENDKGRA